MDWTGIAESLTEDDILDLVSQLQAITLKNGKKPFLVEQRGKAYIDIRLLNPTWTAVLMYHKIEDHGETGDVFGVFKK
jgi:hypothetical protein